MASAQRSEPLPGPSLASPERQGSQGAALVHPMRLNKGFDRRPPCTAERRGRATCADTSPSDTMQKLSRQSDEA